MASDRIKLWEDEMRTALVGSNGYIAGYILKRFEEDEDIKSVLRIDLLILACAGTSM